jgi:hypothetical protein
MGTPEFSSMRMLGISRRWFLRGVVYSIPVVCVADAFWIEPEWVAVREVKISEEPRARFVHFTDLHHKGEREYLSKVITRINDLSPDFVCFTGDIVEDKSYLMEALDCLSELRAPTYGVPGNWDYVSRDAQSEVDACFDSTGGAWLRNAEAWEGDCRIIGVDNRVPQAESTAGARKQILLTHYPTDADDVSGDPYDLILAGHSHGGQCRVPFFGPIVVPDRVGRYDRGLFDTPGGPLYVNPGIGTFLLSVRFACRPEITVFEI